MAIVERQAGTMLAPELRTCHAGHTNTNITSSISIFNIDIYNIDIHDINEKMSAVISIVESQAGSMLAPSLRTCCAGQ